MKTPDEIKKGLECCAGVGLCNTDCPYKGTWHPDCVIQKSKDAFAYIQQLEADNAQLHRCVENMTDKLNAANDEAAKLQTERDAAMADISKGCFSCKHEANEIFEEPCNSCRRTGGDTDLWQWRGVQKEM